MFQVTFISLRHVSHSQCNIQQIKWNISMTSLLTFSTFSIMLFLLVHFLNPLWMTSILFDLNMYYRFSFISKLINWVISDPTVHKHCMKSVQIRSFLLVRIFPYSVQMRENTDQEKLRIWTCGVFRGSLKMLLHILI